MDVKVSIINIGNELLLGQTVNTNLSWLGTELAFLGLPVTKAVTIQDDPEAIRTALSQEWQQSDVVIMTGGLGLTKDDITKAVIADFFGKEMEFRPEIWEKVQAMFAFRGMATPEINKSQALVPEGFEAFTNARGTAPGLCFKDNGKLFFALPGVPVEMKYLFGEYISDILKKAYSRKPIILRTIHTWNTSESALAEKLSELRIPDEIKLAWLPQTGRVDLRIYGSNEWQINELHDKIQALAAEYVWGYDGDTPASVLQNLLLEKELTLAAAESCTGGLVGKLLTDVPGASNYFAGSLVSYSNPLKQSMLGVKGETLERSGAVSIETAQEMAEGIRKEAKADIGISVTGIAGPEGGSSEKPVGTVCFGIASGKGTYTGKTVFTGDRNGIRTKAAEYLILSTIEYIRREL
jgi:nicotinamide-nucleotide amidase